MMLIDSCGCDGGGNDRPCNSFPEKAWTESDGGQGAVPISKYSKLEPPTAKSKTQDCIS